MREEEASARGTGRSYHHGDLRAALLAAAEAELQANGPQGFSLRATARRANVSHGAPAHHFSSAQALLSALAELGFARMGEQMEKAIAAPGLNAVDRLAAAGQAYVGFARDNAELFRLMFSGSQRAAAQACGGATGASQRAFGLLRNCVVAVLGTGAKEADVTSAILTAWGVVHGIAHLSIEGVAGAFDPLETWADRSIANVAAALAQGAGQG